MTPDRNWRIVYYMIQMKFKNINLRRIPFDIHREFKQFCAANDTSMRACLIDYIRIVARSQDARRELTFDSKTLGGQNTHEDA